MKPFFFPIIILIFAASCSRTIPKPETSEPPAATPREEALAPLLELHNKERMKRSLKPLKLDEALCKYAQKHAESMSKNNSLHHSSMSSLAKASGAGAVAENIAWGQSSEEEVLKSWMGSWGHKSNILGSYSKMGFGISKDKDGRKYWCVVFSS
jgi:uncharacterized protein YkwD